MEYPKVEPKSLKKIKELNRIAKKLPEAKIYFRKQVSKPFNDPSKLEKLADTLSQEILSENPSLLEYKRTQGVGFGTDYAVRIVYGPNTKGGEVPLILPDNLQSIAIGEFNNRIAFYFMVEKEFKIPNNYYKA